MSKRLTTSKFIERATTKHGDRYDYSLVEYTASRVNINIICVTHGPFTQLPNNHLSGNGCPSCAGVTTLTTEEFIQKAESVHGNRYDYSKARCVSYLDKLTIICSIHGEFYQSYENHLDGRGCRKCGTMIMRAITRKTYDQFVIESTHTHGDKYDYSLVEYVNNNTNVKIKCKLHGVFSQSPSTHISGSGCPSCSVTCFDTSKISHLYILASTCGSMMKIGVTGKFNRRIIELKCSTPFDFDIVESFRTEGSIVKLIEKSLHDMSSRIGLKNFNGSTEWFEYDGDVIEVARTIFK